jgi:tripartite-type tricarboxylate transporter receptor subunit TctC
MNQQQKEGIFDMRQTLKLLALAAAAAGAALAPASAQDAAWPSGPVTIVVPYGTGGGTDSTARALADALSRQLGVPVTVENHTGAGGSIGGMHFADNAEPDGQMLFVGQTGIVTTVPILNEVTYTQDDFGFVARLANPVEVLVASNEFPPNTPAEFVEYSRENPEALAMVYGGIGSQGWMGVQQLQEELGFEIPSVPIPSGSGADQATMVAGNHAQAGVISLTGVRSFIDNGMLKPIGLLQGERTPYLPDVPTFQEAGFGVLIGDEISLYGDPDMSAETLAAIDAAIVAAFEDEAFIETLTNLSLVPNYGDADTLREVIAARTEMANQMLATE